jgi:hypothetical protein
VCDNCEKLMDENAKLTEEVSGHLHTIRKQSRDIGRLKRELDDWRVNPDGSESKEANLVRRTLKYWHLKLEKPDAVKIVLSGKRAQAVRQAIRWGWDTVPELKAVVDGLALAPYEVYGVRRSTGAPSSRKDDLIQAFKDEHTIETLIAIAAPHVRPGEQTSMNGDGP